MVIKILGPVGSGKSTISKKLSEKLGFKYIPEFEEDDLTFYRLLEERNTCNSSKSKIDFQKYTFEQAYRRQINQDNCVIDTPIYQHTLMAEQSLSASQYINYLNCYLDKIINTHVDNEILIFIKIPLEETFNRIKSRGRKQEKLSEEEIKFYTKFYNRISEENNINYLNKLNKIVVDGNKSVDEIIDFILSKLNIDVSNKHEKSTSILEDKNSIIVGKVIDSFYRKDRRYWYKLLEIDIDFYVMFYDYNFYDIGYTAKLEEYNKFYIYNNFREAVKAFSEFKKKYCNN